MKKQLSLLLGGLLLASSLVACGAKGSTASTTAAASDKETAAESTTAKEGESKAEASSDSSDFTAQILFCGSTSLYPIMSSLASSFTEKYETWDKVDASFPKENISIYVAPGGSGVGVKAAVDGTADFGMLARDIKDKEVESLGKDYKSFEVAKDALTVSVSSKNPNADKLENSFFFSFTLFFSCSPPFCLRVAASSLLLIFERREDASSIPFWTYFPASLPWFTALSV